MKLIPLTKGQFARRGCMSDRQVEVPLDDGTLFVPPAYAQAVAEERVERGHLTVAQAYVLVEKWAKADAA